MRPIVLSGFMASGKSTLGPRLAARLGVPFVDTDDLIAREAGRSVPDLWRDEGEAAFRARERAVIARLLAAPEPAVLAFGGGAVTVRETRHLALERAIVVTLTASPETLVARAGELGTRPNLAVGGDPLARAKELLDQRAEAYAECHMALSTEQVEPDACVDAVVALAERAPLVMPLGSRTYTIDLVVDAPARLTDAVASTAPSSVVVVTDAHVQRARGAAIEAALHPLALPGTRVVLPAGEQHKTLATVSTIWDAALGGGLDRDALVLAIGGGVVGDLAGFAASTVLRGVRFVQVPTTLLAMVDASVGGKTGFDHPIGKNLIGTFHQPSAVVVDLAHLSTLPERERTAGLAEVVKIALATDAGLLATLERHAADIRRGEPAALLAVIRGAIQAKIRIVRDDEREQGRRALLNLGHTVGHALEAHSGYSRYLHGEAVAIGTVVELAGAARMGRTPATLVGRVTELLRGLGLPTAPKPGELSAAWPFVAADKKRTRSAVRMPIVMGPGESTVEAIELDELRAATVR